ncbi:MAG: histidine kinase [Bacteroidetes bacterium QH_7_62_13]|jgi:signal transduction histidine kinase|nr:MAG: histidine kinase [Bacteroidetes bacterium QH_7_62_13]
MSDSDPPDSLHEMHEEISSVYHDMNNPLSIISGNAQFLLELSREKNVGEEFISSVRDIKEATERMSDSLSRLTRLKEELEDLA